MSFPIICWGWEGLCIRGYLLLTPGENFSMKCCFNGKCNFRENAISYGKVSLQFVSEKDRVFTETKEHWEILDWCIKQRSDLSPPQTGTHLLVHNCESKTALSAYPMDLTVLSPLRWWVFMSYSLVIKNVRHTSLQGKQAVIPKRLTLLRTTQSTKKSPPKPKIT